jgi:membrane protein required for colicin V production
MYLDLALLAICLVSGLLAMYRGLAREVLSILSWVAAAGAALYFVMFHKTAAEQLSKQYLSSMDPKTGTVITQVVVGGVIFLLTLIIVHLITARISDAILDSRIGMIDRLLGLGFGIIRGFLVVMILFMFYEEFFPDPKNQYPWVRDARSASSLRGAGQPIKGVLTNLVQKISTKTDPQ